jgi:hypothetical protein
MQSKIKTRSFPRQRHFLAVFFMSFMWGVFGVDRMYLGKWGSGIAKLLTIGGLGIWVCVDLIRIMNGTMRDAQGRPMLEFEAYRRFASRTVLIFAVVLGVVVLINGILVILSINQLFTMMQGEGLDSLLQGLPSGTHIPEDLQGYL